LLLKILPLNLHTSELIEVPLRNYDEKLAKKKYS